MEKQQKLSAPEIAAMAAAIEQFNRECRAHSLDELRRTYHIEAIYCTDAADVKAANFDKFPTSDYTEIVKSNE